MNKIQHFFQTLFILTVFSFFSFSTNLQAQACPTDFASASCAAGSFIVLNGEFDSTPNTCPMTITLSDGTNTAVLSRPAGSSCNTAEEAYTLAPNSSSFDCSATEFTVDIGTEICNYITGGSFTSGSNGVVLPVELSKFIAYSNEYSILVEWETIMELENDFFTVEKSTDGRTFAEIAKLDGAGISIEVNKYMFIDKEPVDGRNYYRLKQTDINGNFEYFEVAIVNYRDAGSISIYPNPVSETMKINLTSNLVGQTADIVIFSISSGKQVILKSIDAIGYELNINTAELPAGMYTVVVNVGNQIFNKKIVKN